MDQKLVDSIWRGYLVLQDCLDWINTHKKLMVAKHTRMLVDEHMKNYMPVLAVEGYESLPVDLQGLVAKMPKVPDLSVDTSSKRLMVFLLDFNIPGVSWLIWYNGEHSLLSENCAVLSLIFLHVDPT